MKKTVILLLLLHLVTVSVGARRATYNSFYANRESVGDVSLYGGLTHQHQNFLNTPFSLTGLEAGVLVDNTIVLGAFGSSFLSGLDVETANLKTTLSLAQGGLVFGAVHHFTRYLEAGLLLQSGFLSVRGEPSGISAEGSNNRSVHHYGATVIPQLFTAISTTKWMKIRVGLGYNFYSFGDQSVVSSKDLQNVSLNFGFLFGTGDLVREK